MLLTDLYIAKKNPLRKNRFEIETSTGEYDFFEDFLINRRGLNIGSLSINLVQRPGRWAGRKFDYALTKGSSNITSIKRPDPKSNIGFGDIKSTNDACIIIFNTDFQTKDIHTIEIVIARGLKNDVSSLWNIFTDGDFDNEVEALRKKAVTKSVTNRICKC